MVRFNHGLLHDLCGQVEGNDDAQELVDLSDEIVRLINDKRRRIALAKTVDLVSAAALVQPVT
jgi:hypothetical protein